MKLGLFLTAVAFSLSSTAVAEQTLKSGSEILKSTVIASARQTNAAVFLDVQGCGLSLSTVAGIANRSTKSIASADMSLRLGSVGKLYTAAVIHRLVARGILDLDAPSTRYLDGKDAVGVANRDATIRQLLDHTGGIPDYYAAPAMKQWDWRKPLTPERVMAAIKFVRADTVSGSKYSYSNSGYHLAALAAERATGQGFSDLMQTEVFGPLGLHNTRYNLTAPGGSLHGYVGKKDRWQSAENTGADSGVTETLADTTRFLRALFIDEGPMRAIGKAMVENPIETGNRRQRAGPGAELRTSPDGIRLIGHTGNVEGYLSFAYVAPDYTLSMVGHMSAGDDQVFANLLRTTAQIIAVECRRLPMPQ